MAESYLNILAETIRNNWDQPALTDFYLTEDGKSQDKSRGNHYTYGEMYAEIVRVADLLTNLGLQRGDHIAICGANSAHWVIAYLAIAKMQGVSVTVMHALQPDQVAQMVDFSDAKALFVDDDLWEELKEKSLPQVKNVMGLDDWSVLFGEKQIINNKLPISNDQCHFVHGEADELAMICFTSGSTSHSKGVMLSYRNLTTSIESNYIYFTQFHRKHAVSILPMGHVYGLMAEILQPLCLGIYISIFANSGSLNRLMEFYNRVKPEYLIIVPYILNQLVQYALKESANNYQKARHIFDKITGGTVKVIGVGGAAILPEEEKKMMMLQLPILTGYGVSECGPRISLSTSIDNVRLGASGVAVPNTTIEIALNGEILVKGENVMLGYYKDPEATAQKIDKDGWLHTGDKGHLDEDGYLYVEGRLEQDIIVLPNGENIRPDNIESLINALPEVSESIVLARDGKLVARVVVRPSLLGEGKGVRLSVLRTINPQLPLFSQLYDVEITDIPLQRTEKQTLKRYLYK